MQGFVPQPSLRVLLLLVLVLRLCHVKVSSPTDIDGEAQGNPCKRASISDQGLVFGILLHIRQTGVQQGLCLF